MYILIVIFILVGLIIYVKYDSIVEFVGKVKTNYQSIKNIEGIKSQMTDLEGGGVDSDSSAEVNKNASKYSEKINELYNIVSLKYFDIFEKLSDFLDYLYADYLLPLYYKNFYIRP